MVPCSMNAELEGTHMLLLLLQVPSSLPVLPRLTNGLPRNRQHKEQDGHILGKHKQASLRSSFLLNPLGFSSCPAPPLWPWCGHRGRWGWSWTWCV